MRQLVNVVRVILVVVAGVLALALAGNALTYFNFDPQYSFLRLKQQAIETGWYLPAYYSHVLISGLILIIGFFQLHPKSNTKFRKTHRALGYFYVMGILFFAAPGGLVMGFFINRGPWVLMSFIMLAVLWFCFTAIAFNQIRKGDIDSHKKWMWRSYALTFSAITLRIYIFITSYSMDLSQPEAYATLAWLSWVPNLLVVEFFLSKRKVLS